MDVLLLLTAGIGSSEGAPERASERMPERVIIRLYHLNITFSLLTRESASILTRREHLVVGIPRV